MKKKTLFNVFFYLGLLILLVITVSLAWFNNGKTGEADDIVFAAVDAPYCQISFDGENYVNEGTITPDGILSKPISGTGTKDSSGNVQLWTLDFEDDTFSTVKEGSVAFASLDDNDFYEFDVYIKSTLLCDISLSGDSKVLPYDLEDNSRVNSLFGNIHEDYIAGAIRVSFSEVTTTGSSESENLKLVWIPNSDYEFQRTSLTDCKVVTGSTNAENYRYFNGSAFASVNFNADDNLFSCTPPSALSTTIEADGCYIAHYKIRIWVEGTDREAVTELSGGNFKVSLIFLAKEAEASG